VRYLSSGTYGGMERGHWGRKSGGIARADAGRRPGGVAVSYEGIADIETVDSGTHGDPKPGEPSKHMKPFDRTKPSHPHRTPSQCY
jgi:hypothetical protein